VLEGGSIDVNGAGVLMTTEECLLSPIQARNPDLTRTEIERALHQFLGAEKILWLKNGIVGDDTHGHIDDVARFVSPETIVIATEFNEADENHEILRQNRELLEQESYKVVELPMPAPLYFEGRRLPASYANFYIANELVLVPTFNDANDRKALDTLASVFPTRRIVGIHAVELVWGLGTLHCMTQQQPA
jgi:agmatine deiminase